MRWSRPSPSQGLQMLHRPPSWRLCRLHTGGGFLLLSDNLDQISFEIMRYFPGEFLQLLVGDPHKLPLPYLQPKQPLVVGWKLNSEYKWSFFANELITVDLTVASALGSTCFNVLQVGNPSFLCKWLLLRTGLVVVLCPCQTDWQSKWASLSF